jgi:SAM-dependent methyltransferase
MTEQASSYIEHYELNGARLLFENPPGLYPVNRYQSLVLASCAVTEALTWSAQRQAPLSSARAIEVCCGGGPAALALKSAGVGSVEASDLNPRMLEACHRNAEINHLALARVTRRDLLTPDDPLVTDDAPFDIIVCNPPCGRSAVVDIAARPDMKLALDGGEDGLNLLPRLLEDSRRCLADGGRLVFVLTSTMSIPTALELLNHHAAGQWRVAAHTPIAQPYGRPDDPRSQTMLALREEYEAFVWVQDQVLWRMTWIIVMHKLPDDQRPLQGGLWFRPHGYDPSSPDYIRSRDRFEERFR